MEEFGKIILVILLSSVKFVAGPPFAYYDTRYDFTFFETVLYCVIGGTLGVVIFTYFSKHLFAFGHYLKIKFNKMFRKKTVFSDPVADINAPVEIHYEYMDVQAKKKKLFTRKNRHIVRVWKLYGLVGIAFITPVILSIPIGTLIANSFVNSRKKVILYMFFSIVFWSITMTSMFEFFHAVTIKDLREHILEE